PARGSSGTDTCGYTCYRCCDDTCPSGTSKNYTGSYASTTECGSRCNRCKDCSSGKTYWNGSYVGSSECGSCYSCSDTCSSGSRGGASCSSGYDEVYVGSTECGSSCYECQYNPDCSVTSKSCTYGCSSYNSCDKCTSCLNVSGSDCKTYYYEEQSCNGWCDFLNGGPKKVVCGKRRMCTTYDGSTKQISISYRGVAGPFYDDDGNGDGGQGECIAAKGSGNNCC
ncbi:MAG: hypothetical protein J6L86_02300, partial [Alphaproteobacteria bacterium]|nr:hypothetical protein [Alphaproteobacteria bacterium]